MTFQSSRKIFSIILVLLIFAGSAANIYIMRQPFAADLKALALPDSIDAVKAEIGKMEKSVNNNIPFKTKFIDAFAYLCVILGKNEISDFAQVKSDTGSLFYGNPFPVDTSQTQQYARRVARLKRAAEADGAKVLFLNPPDMVIKGYSKFEKGLPFQDLNVMQDAFLNHLREYGVDYLDARYSLRDNEDLPPDKYIYKTDHHWTVEASFEAFRDLVQKLNDRFGAGLDTDGFYRDKANYISQTYPNYFVGSLGRSTGVIFSGLEDLTLILPAFDSEYTVEMIDFLRRYINRSGPAEKSLFYSSAFQSHDPYMMIPNNYYLSGISPWVRIVNHKNPDGPRMLLVHDSYSLPLACFLAPLFSEIHMIWPLADNPVQVKQYMADTRFDYVVVELISTNINERGMHFFLEDDNEALKTQ